MTKEQTSKSPPDGTRACVIVVTFNCWSHFAQQKRALEAQTCKSFELVVWDNGSRGDQRPNSADFPPFAKIVQSEINLGFAAANNRAASLTDAEYIVLLNPDAFPEPDWLERLIAAADRHPEAAMIASLQISSNDPSVLDGAGDCYSPLGAAWRGLEGRPIGEAPDSGEVFAPCAAAALYRREDFQGVGGFDERFFCYYEDVDLAFRLRLAGRKCFFEKAARVAHVGSAVTGKQSSFSDYHIARNRLWTFFKNMPLPLLFLLGPGAAALTLWILVRTAGSARFGPNLKGTIDALKGLPHVLQMRKQTKALRKVRLSELASAFCWSLSALLRREADVRPWRYEG